jgi:hypothetical protein
VKHAIVCAGRTTDAGWGALPWHALDSATQVHGKKEEDKLRLLLSRGDTSVCWWIRFFKSFAHGESIALDGSPRSVTSIQSDFVFFCQ